MSSNQERGWDPRKNEENDPIQDDVICEQSLIIYTVGAMDIRISFLLREIFRTN